MELRATVWELKELQRIMWSLQGLQLRPSKILNEILQT